MNISTQKQILTARLNKNVFVHKWYSAARAAIRPLNCTSLALVLVFTTLLFAQKGFGQVNVGPNDAGAGATSSGTGSWTNPGNIAAAGSATVALGTGTNSQYLKSSNYGFSSIPSNAIITGIKVSINRQGVLVNGFNFGIADVEVRLLKAGLITPGDNKAVPDAWPATFAVKDYGGSSDLWGVTWSPADIADPGFGVLLSIKNKSNIYSNTASVDYMQVTVTYKMPCATPSDPPTSLSFSGNSTSTLTGSFTASSGSPGANGYLVIRSTGTVPSAPVDHVTYSAANIATLGAGLTFVQNSGSTSFNETGLSSNTQFTYYVYAFNNDVACAGPSYLTTPLTGSSYTCIDQPTSLGTTVTANSATLTWSVPNGAVTSYDLLYKQASDPSYTTITGVSSGYTLTGLSVATSYNFQVVATNSNNTSCGTATSATATFATLCGAPTDQPLALTLSGNTSTSIGGSFIAPSSSPLPDAYLVVASTNPSLSSNPVDGITYTVGQALGGGTVVSSGAPISFTASGLTSNALYYFFVYSFNNSGCSATYLAATPLSGSSYTCIAAPTALATNTVTNNSANLTWTAPSGTITSYDLQYMKTGDPGFTTVTGVTSPYALTGLSGSADYTFKIVANNANNTSCATATSGTVTFTTQCASPAAQATNLLFSGNTITAINGAFTAPSGSPGASGYLVIRSAGTVPSAPVNGTTYTSANISNLGSGLTFVQSGSAISFNQTGLTSNTQYTYYVYAFNNTACTGLAYFTTPLTGSSYTCIDKPTSLGTNTLTGNSANLTWTAPSGIVTSYDLQYMKTGDPGFTTITGVTSGYTLAGLSGGTGYTFQVVAKNANNTSCGSATSTTKTFTTPCATPDQPTNLAFSGITTSAIGGSFTAASSSPNGYFVVRSTSSTLSSTPQDGTSYTAGNSFGGGTIVQTGASTTLTASTSLTSSTRYYFFVYSYNNSGCPIIYSKASPLTGSVYTCIAPPTGVTTSNLTYNSVKLTWTAPSGTVTSYDLQYMKTGDPGFTTITGVTSGYVLTGLLATTNYTVQIVANNSGSTSCGSATSTPKAFTTPVDPPTQFVITTIPNQIAGTGFSVTVQAQNSSNLPSNVVTATAFTLSTNGNAGTIGGTITGTIAAGSGSATVSGVILSAPGTGVTITATRTSGDNLTAGVSNTFDVSGFVSNSTDYFKSQASTAWNLPATWLSSHDGTNYYTATVAPTSSANTIVVLHNVNVPAAVTVDQVTVSSGELKVDNGVTLTINDGTGTDLTATAGTLTVNGTIDNRGVITSTSGTAAFNNGATYKHNQDGGSIPTATWNNGSTCLISGISSSSGWPSGTGQTFSNFTLANSGGSSTATMGSITCNGDFTFANDNSGRPYALSNSSSTATLTVGGDFKMQSGTFIIANSSGSGTVNLTASKDPLTAGNFIMNGGTFTMSSGSSSPAIGTMNVKGNFSLTGGTITESNSSSGRGEIVFNGSRTQTYTSGGTVSSTINFTVNGGSTLQMAANSTTVKGGGAFTLSNGATLGVTSPAGITISTNSGNIQVTGTRTYTSGANYIYNGDLDQYVGDGLAQHTPANLTLDNAGIVTLSAVTSITGNILISRGTLSSNSSSYNLSVGGNWTNNGVFDARSSTVDFNGSGASNIGASNFNNITFSGSPGAKTATGVLAIAGNVSITSNFTAGAFTHKVGGNWSKGGVFNATGSTIDFNGSVSSNIGASNFNNITFSNAGSKTATGPLTIAGNVSLLSYFNAGSYTHTVSGNWPNGGTLAAGTSIIHFNSTNPQIIPAYTYYNLQTSASAKTLGGNVSVNDLILTSGTFAVGAGQTLRVNGVLPSSAPISIDPNSTISFGGDNSQTVPTYTYGELNLGGLSTKTFDDNIYARDLTFAAGNNATLVLPGSNTLYVSGNFVGNNLTNISANSTLIYNGTSSQSLPAYKYGNVIINNTGVTTLAGALTGANMVMKSVTLNAGIFDNGGYAIACAPGGNKFAVNEAATFIIRGTGTFPSGFSSVDFTPNSIAKYESTAPVVETEQYGKLVLVGGSKTLGGDVTVLTEADLLNGNVELGAYNFTMGVNGNILNPSASNYLKQTGIGKLIIQGIGSNGRSGDVLFPVGTSTYTPAYIRNAVSVQDFSVIVTDNLLKNGTSGAVIADHVVNKTWHVENATGTVTPDVTLTLQWTQPSDNAANFLSSNCGINHFSNNGWDQPASYGSATVNGTTYSVSRSGISSFSPFGVTDGNNPLPVSLVYFNVVKREGKALLQWETATEKNNQGFEVQASSDGKNFERIGFVESHNPNSNTIQDYEFAEKGSRTGVWYYRLMQTDLDGTVSVYGPKMLDFGKLSETIVAYPNPFAGQFELKLNAAAPTEAALQLTDMTGKTVYQHTEKLVSGENNLKVALNGKLPAGVYFLTVRTGTQTYTTRMIKE